MRAAANKPNINIVAVNDPFIPVDYSEFDLSFIKVVTRHIINDDSFFFVSNENMHTLIRLSLLDTPQNFASPNK